MLIFNAEYSIPLKSRDVGGEGCQNEGEVLLGQYSLSISYVICMKEGKRN